MSDKKKCRMCMQDCTSLEKGIPLCSEQCSNLWLKTLQGSLHEVSIAWADLRLTVLGYFGRSGVKK